MVHRAAILLGARADARVRLEGDDDLVHQGLVEIAGEEGVRRVESAGGAFVVDHLELHGAPHFFAAGAAAAGLAGAAAGLATDLASAFGCFWPLGPAGLVILIAGR